MLWVPIQHLEGHAVYSIWDASKLKGQLWGLSSLSGDVLALNSVNPA